MVDNSKPLSKEILRKFVAGMLDEAENEAIMTRLAEDEDSLEIVDALWNEQSSTTAVPHLPDLEADQAQRMRHRLVQQIQRANLTKNIVRMGTQGFGSVAIGLLRPLLTNKNRTRRHRRRQ